MIGFLIALLSGALMSVQGVFNTKVTETDQERGFLNAWVQLTAFLVWILGWFIAGRDDILSIGKVEPRYLLLGGVIGAGITLTVIKSVDALGPAKAGHFPIVIAQLFVAYLIELFGLFGVDKEPFSWRKIGGLVLALIGISIFQWK